MPRCAVSQASTIAAQCARQRAVAEQQRRRDERRGNYGSSDDAGGYGSEEASVQLDKLGNASWQARRARVKNRITDMADKLMALAAERELRHAPKLTPAIQVVEAVKGNALGGAFAVEFEGQVGAQQNFECSKQGCRDAAVVSCA